MGLEYAPRGLIGCLTPQANTTVEPEMSVLLPAGFGFLNARLVSAKPSMEQRLVDYYRHLDQALAQFANAPLNAIAVACTGASYLAGRKREAELVSAWSGRAGIPVVTAALAVTAALETIGARRIDLLSCYPPDLTRASLRYWESHGLEIGEVVSLTGDRGSFHPIYSLRADEASDALGVLRRNTQDAILMLGTGMPTLRSIADLAGSDGSPVLSCMLCLAWRCVTLIKAPDAMAESVISWSRGAGWARRLHRYSVDTADPKSQS